MQWIKVSGRSFNLDYVRYIEHDADDKVLVFVDGWPLKKEAVKKKPSRADPYVTLLGDDAREFMRRFAALVGG